MDEKHTNKTSNNLQNFDKDILKPPLPNCSKIFQKPKIDYCSTESNKFEYPKFEYPKFDFPEIDPIEYDDDCEFVNVCKYTTDDCYAGAPILVNSRCSKERINEMLDKDEITPTQSIRIERSDNVQINQQGNHSTSQQSQSVTINDLPIEIIDEFKELILLPANESRSKWQSFLEKFNTYGGTVVLLADLFKLFTM